MQDFSELTDEQLNELRTQLNAERVGRSLEKLEERVYEGIEILRGIAQAVFASLEKYKQ